MTMHLLPAYWTTNNHKKRKKKTKTTLVVYKSLKTFGKLEKIIESDVQNKYQEWEFHFELSFYQMNIYLFHKH